MVINLHRAYSHVFLVLRPVLSYSVCCTCFVWKTPECLLWLQFRGARLDWPRSWTRWCRNQDSASFFLLWTQVKAVQAQKFCRSLKSPTKKFCLASSSSWTTPTSLSCWPSAEPWTSTMSCEMRWVQFFEALWPLCVGDLLVGRKSWFAWPLVKLLGLLALCG